MQVGTARADTGELARGWLDVADLPTGTPERLPVVIARGTEDGPTLWVTASIHGNEVTGLAVAQDVLWELRPDDLRGAVVGIPTVNPAGLRRNVRTSYYHDDDPNRSFPDPEDERVRPPRVQELIGGRVYEAFTGRAPADALLDLHTAHVGSMPFAIRDRVLYGERRDEGEAQALADDLDRLAAAVDLPVVTEYPVAEYTEQNLQRSTAGAALNAAGIPSLTLELGGHATVEEDVRAAGVAGVYRALVELGMLDAVPTAVAAADPGFEAPVDYPVRRARHPRTGTPGIVRHHVEAGDALAAGDAVGEIVTPHGEPVVTVETEHDGYVLGRQEGAVAYENDAIASMAVRDEDDRVAPREDAQ